MFDKLVDLVQIDIREKLAGQVANRQSLTLWRKQQALMAWHLLKQSTGRPEFCVMPRVME